jgi:hypothetical protein
MKYKLVSQDDFFREARRGSLTVSLACSFRFANGIFVRGVYENGKEIYATIREEFEDVFQDMLDIQRDRKQGGLTV